MKTLNNSSKAVPVLTSWQQYARLVFQPDLLEVLAIVAVNLVATEKFIMKRISEGEINKKGHFRIMLKITICM